MLDMMPEGQFIMYWTYDDELWSKTLRRSGKHVECCTDYYWVDFDPEKCEGMQNVRFITS